MKNVRVGFSDAFFSALTKLAPNIQAKVNQMVLKFQNNPKSPGLNYEKLNAVKDPNMRSLRVDQSYRVILSAPESGNVYLFLWVDHHDQAYDWAAKHKCNVNPNTGAVQLYASDIKSVSEMAGGEDTKEAKPLFGELKERHLLKLGIPEEQISVVRDITLESQLDSVQALLPEEAYEALFLILAGESYESIIIDRQVDESSSYDVNNFADALERIQSQARFVVPNDEEELGEMLNATIEKWRVFLHPSQRRLATGVKNGPVRVLGGAGTGKTVVAMHRAKWLAEHVASDNKKVLFTTFTKNLAIDIQNHLSTICSPETFSRIEVVNLDRWVQNFLRKQSYDYELVFDDKTLNSYWAKAISEKPSDIDFPDSFFKEEWQRVIQPQGIKSVDEYKKASRIGRGTRLNREQRIKSWVVYEEYRYQLNRARQKEADDCYRDAGELIRTQKLELPYCSIVVDEAQDMGTQAFMLLRSMIPEEKNDLFLVGDAHQRIYGRNKVVLGRCGINIVGRSNKLKINYRTTDEIRKWAVNLLEGRDIDDLDGNSDDNKLYKSLTHGQPPMMENFESSEDQAGFIKALLEKSDLPYSHTCVVTRTNREIQSIQNLLSSLDIPTSIIRASEAENRDDTVLKLATIHRVKGLEFDQVILASANEAVIPLAAAMRDKGDKSSSIEAETEERSLVYVAITRARKFAVVLSYGKKSVFF